MQFGCTGRITGVLRGGKELDVIFGGHSTRQLPSVLLKVNKFSVGDRVKITNDPGMTADLFKASGDVQKAFSLKIYISYISAHNLKLLITVCWCSWYSYEH